MKTYLSLSLIVLASISNTSFAQNKSLALIQYEAVHGPYKETVDENKNNIPKGKYDHLTKDQRERYEEIERQNADLLSKRPNDYLEKKRPSGVVADPNSGVFINVAPSQVNNTSQNQVLGIQNNGINVNGESQYRSQFGAMRQRKLSALVTSWSGKEGQYLFWDYSKDYDINNASIFNKEAKLNEAIGLDDAINKIFRYIAIKEQDNPRHLPPKICYEGNTIYIVDTNVDCE